MPRHTARFLTLALAATGALAAPAVAHASVTNGPIGRSEVLARAQYWVDSGITYTQTGTWFRDPEGDKTYRRDCSGLVSMAWHLGTSYVTGDFQGTSQYWTRLASRDQLAPGDAIVRNGHMELFSHWKNSGDHNQGAYVYSFNTDGETVQNPWAGSNRGNQGFNSAADLASYTPIRRTNLAATNRDSLSADGHAELIRKDAAGDLFAYYNNGVNNAGAVAWSGAVKIGNGWNDPDGAVYFADLDGNGQTDAIRKDSAGALFAYYNHGVTGSLTVRWTGPKQIGVGWTMADDSVYFADLTGDGYAEAIRKDPNGDLFAYYNHGVHGTGSVAWGSPVRIGIGWPADGNAIQFADISGDGYAEALRKDGGKLFAYYNNGINSDMTVRWNGPIEIDSGLTVPDTSVYFGDLNGDTRADRVTKQGTDLVVRYNNGITGDMKVTWGAPTTVGTGWDMPDTSIYVG
ncbi:hypothetical protein [Actinoplanes sp. NPDC049802]|uniref:hypothetical protein n=1 Tax=Actinoplanes sp. NPDC049802 TaxID=3154742 RepID=UPI0033CF9C22